MFLHYFTWTHKNHISVIVLYLHCFTQQKINLHDCTFTHFMVYIYI
jgi:hypothetical protein